MSSTHFHLSTPSVRNDRDSKNTASGALSRRRFLFQSGVVTGVILSGPNLLLRGQDAAGKRLNLAVVGCMGKGHSDTQSVQKAHNIVALVDVDSESLKSAAKGLGEEAGRKARQFADFRKMLDEMHSSIDGVIISTPDHTHFPAAMWALKHKKPVCVQKPLCNTIWETRELHKAALKAGVLTQMGNQGRTLEGQRLAKEWVDRGLIGTLKEVRLWTNRPIWPQGPMKKNQAECPPFLNWDLWLSTEPSEPYFEFDAPKKEEKTEQGKKKKASRKRDGAVHPFNWRGWWQFGSGALGDMGCHIMDATFSVLGQRVPEKVEVTSPPVSALNAPAWSHLVYHFAATGNFPKLTVSWHDGVKDGKPNLPERDERIPEDEFAQQTSGMMFIGTYGVILADTYCNRPVLYPESKDIEVRTQINNGTYEKKERRSTHPGNPQMEWATAIVNGGITSSNFDYAAPLTEFVLLGNLAIRAGQTVQWDAKAMEVSGNPKATRFVKRPSYRSGWI